MIFRRSSLWLHVAWPFVLFMVIGSVALAAWMQALAERESAAVFSALARTNAEFLKTARIPESEQMMSYLGRMLNMRAFLSHPAQALRPLPEPALAAFNEQLRTLQPGDGVRHLGGEFEAIAARVDVTTRLILVRPAEPGLAFLRRRDTIGVLGAFCLLSVVLAAVVSRGVLKAERLALLGRLATGLAHEIHNPLSSIRLHAQLLESAEDLPAAVAQSAPILVDESGRIEALVNQWMFLARPEPPRTRALALAPLVARVVRNYTAQARHARVELEAAVAETLWVQGDERRLTQALANVLLNAIQAMPRGGTVRLAGESAGAEVRLSVTDSGTGFSPTALAHYRELFFSEKEGGMGVGLSVAAEIVEAHGGRFSVTNSAGGGAMVLFGLPAAAHP